MMPSLFPGIRQAASLAMIGSGPVHRRAIDIRGHNGFYHPLSKSWLWRVIVGIAVPVYLAVLVTRSYGVGGDPAPCGPHV